MTDPCTQDRRITKTETVVDVVIDGLKTLTEKTDKILEKVGILEGKFETLEKAKNTTRQDGLSKEDTNKLVIGALIIGSAATTILGFALFLLKPLLKLIPPALSAVIK